MGLCGSAEASAPPKAKDAGSGSAPDNKPAGSGEQKPASGSSAGGSQPIAVQPKKMPHEEKNPDERFEQLKLLGEGASCKVVMCRDRETGKHYAMKIIQHKPEFAQMFEVEKAILGLLHHPNVVEFFDAFEDRQKKTWRILTGMCRGGELFDRVKTGSFSEKAAARLTREMLQAVHYIHTQVQSRCVLEWL